MHKYYGQSILIFSIIITLFFSGCASNTVKVKDGEELNTETTQLQESRLLDVGILVFEKGDVT